MRTTVELPPDLFRLAKARSAERGESLKTLLTRAVAAEVGHVASGPRPRPWMALPLFGDPKGPAVRLNNSAIAEYLAGADAAVVSESKSGRSSRRRRRDAPRR